MKWFIKVLRHYADFRGRARRKEYWMFVLFNAIFSFVWALLVSLLFALLIENLDLYVNENSAIYAALSFSVLMLLPGMAVVVRRLHDLGKSGWWFLISFIPLIGGFWILLLMMTPGEDGENKYGPDPKESEEIFEESAKLKSAGITIIAACSALIINILITQIRHYFPFNIFTGISFIAILLFLLAGALLFNKKTIEEVKTEKNALILLLLSSTIFTLLSIFSLYTRLESEDSVHASIIYNFLYIASNLSITAFSAILLFFNTNKSILRYVSISVILISGLVILCEVYSIRGTNANDIYDILLDFLPLLNSLFNVAYIVLAGTFLSKNKNTTLANPMNTSIIAILIAVGFFSCSGNKNNDSQTLTEEKTGSIETIKEEKNNGIFEIISFNNDSVKFATVAETKFYAMALVSGDQQFEGKSFSNSVDTVRWANGSRFWPGSSMGMPATFGVDAMTLPKGAVLTVFEFDAPAGFKATKIRFTTEGTTEMNYNILKSSWDK